MEIITRKNLDARTLNIKKNRQHRDHITGIVKDMIEMAEWVKKVENMPEIWATNAFYNEGHQVAIGTTDNVLKNMVQDLMQKGYLDTTKYRTKKDENNQLWIVDNKVGKIVESMKAYLTGSRKVVTVKSDDYPGNNGIESGVRHLLEMIQKKKRIWEQVWNPCIDMVQVYGLAWYDVTFNRRINYPYGDFQFNYYHPADVLFDPYAKLKYFLDRRYTIRKRQMNVEDAREYFKRFKLSEDELRNIHADSEYSRYNVYNADSKMTPLSSDGFVTLYYGEYTKTYAEKRSLTEDMGLKSLLDEMEISGIDEKSETDLRYKFDFLYTEGLGVVYHGESKYYDKTDFDNDQYDCIPIINKESLVRQHPVSDVEKLIKYQDLINIMKSLILNNARDQNMVRYIMAKAFKKYEKTFMEFLKQSGVFWVDNLSEKQKIGDIMQEVKTSQLPEIVVRFLEIAIEDIKEHGVVHESLEGAYPGSGISGVAIENLKQANMTRLSYKEDNINWAVTTGAQKIYRIYASAFKMEDFVPVANRNQNDPKGFILNGMFTLEEYIQYITENYPGVDIEVASAEFEKYNDVEIQYGVEQRTGEVAPNPEQIMKEKSIVYVNYLINPRTNEPYNLKVTLEMDFKAQRNELEAKIVAGELRGKGDLSRRDYYIQLGPPYSDKVDELIKNLEEENQILKMATALSKNPDALEVVTPVLQNPQMAQIVSAVIAQIGQQQQQTQTKQ